MLDVNQDIEWTPPQYGKRMDDWLRNMGDWNISRRRFYGLPLPFYPCSCGHLNVIGSRAELEARAVGGIEGLVELHRPWIDRVTIACAACGEEVSRVPEVGDVWLDAGIVPFSTLGWKNPEWVPEGYATGASQRAVEGRPARPRVLGAVVPGRLGHRDARADPAVVLLAVLHVGRADRRRAVPQGPDVREAPGRRGPRDARLVGQPHLRRGGVRADGRGRHALAVLPAAADAEPPLRLQGRGRDQAPAADAVELRPLPHGLRLDRGLLAAYARRRRRAARRCSSCGRSTCGCSRASSSSSREAETAYEAYLTVDVARVVETFVEDLSNWYIRRSRRRFYTFDEAAFRTLWTALVQLVRVFAPIMPFLAEHLWQMLVAEPCGEDAPESVHLAGWPAVQEQFVDDALLAEIAATRRVAQLGRRARTEAGLKLRQPLRKVYVRGAPLAVTHAGEIAEELRVKEVAFDEGPVARAELLPNLRVLGPRLGKKLPALRAALKAGDYSTLEGGGVLVAGEELGPDDVIRGEKLDLDGWAIAEDDGISVAFDIELDDELRTEGRVHDLVHELNVMRKEQGFELTDRIAVTLPERDADLLDHGDWIRAEVLGRRRARRRRPVVDKRSVIVKR